MLQGHMDHRFRGDDLCMVYWPYMHRLVEGATGKGKKLKIGEGFFSVQSYRMGWGKASLFFFFFWFGGLS